MVVEAAARERISRKAFLSAPFAKIDAGEHIVYGYATVEMIDQQGEVVSFEASVAAFEEFTERFKVMTGGKSLGNVRVMHQPDAEAKIIDWRPVPEKKAIEIGVKISDSALATWAKISEGILTGFSIGAHYVERETRIDPATGTPVKWVTKLKLSEVSIVDNPACPKAVFTLIKMADPSETGVVVSGHLDPALVAFKGMTGASLADYKLAPKPAKQKKEKNMSVKVTVPGGSELKIMSAEEIAAEENALEKVTPAPEPEKTNNFDPASLLQQPTGKEKELQEQFPNGTPFQITGEIQRAIDSAVEAGVRKALEEKKEKPMPEVLKKSFCPMCGGSASDKDVSEGAFMVHKACKDAQGGAVPLGSTTMPDGTGEANKAMQADFQKLAAAVEKSNARAEALEKQLAALKASPAAIVAPHIGGLPTDIAKLGVDPSLVEKKMAEIQDVCDEELAKKDPVVYDKLQKLLCKMEYKRSSFTM